MFNLDNTLEFSWGQTMSPISEVELSGIGIQDKIFQIPRRSRAVKSENQLLY